MNGTEQTLDILARVCGRDRSALGLDVQLVAELGLDSLKAIELVAELEDGLKVELHDEDVRQMRTVGDVLRALESARQTGR
jgi:acyl carrier protein